MSIDNPADDRTVTLNYTAFQVGDFVRSLVTFLPGEITEVNTGGVPTQVKVDFTGGASEAIVSIFELQRI